VKWDGHRGLGLCLLFRYHVRLCLRLRNVETSCHKLFVDVSRELQTTPLTTSGSVTTCHGLSAACWQHLAAVAALTAGREVRYWLRIAILPTPPASDGPTPPLRQLPSEYCRAVWHRKSRMAWLPMVKKFWRYVCSFWHNSRTWQTHTHTQRERHRHRMTA